MTTDTGAYDELRTRIDELDTFVSGLSQDISGSLAAAHRMVSAVRQHDSLEDADEYVTRTLDQVLGLLAVGSEYLDTLLEARDLDKAHVVIEIPAEVPADA